MARNSSRRQRRIVLLTVCAVVLGLGAGVPAASAGTLTDSAFGCPNYQLERPFLPWLDVAQYGIVPNGAFETGTAGWKLKNGAKVVSGNEPWKVHGSGDSRSLYLPAGSSATSPSVCVELLDPTARFFAKGPLLASLKVEVLYENAFGQTKSMEVLAVVGLSGWQPTLPLLFLANVTGALSLDGKTTAVAFRFTPRGLSSWRIDDVYVDPFKIS